MNVIKNIASVYNVMGLVLLLLLSPCKVRNFIQAELGVEQTQVSSKSKSITPQLICQTQELTQTQAGTTELDKEQLSNAGHIHFNTNFDTTVCKTSIQNDYVGQNLVSPVPFYILYSHLKVYL